jgi:hypothetical protein
VVGSDSGKISVLEFDQLTNDWKVVHAEIYGKTGCRRIVPGQYLAAGSCCVYHVSVRPNYGVLLQIRRDGHF